MRCDTGVCDASGRPHTEWHEAPRGYLVSDSYKQKYPQSETCRMLTMASLKCVGLAIGTWEQPQTAQNLIGFKGAYLIFPTQQDLEVELWVGGKYLNKMGEDAPFKTKAFVGNVAKLELIENVGAALVIDINVRKELWFRNLLIGDQNNLIVCSETGALVIPRLKWNEFKQAFLLLEDKVKREGLVVLRGLASGRLNIKSERVQGFLITNREFAGVCATCLPTDPHARLFWLDAVGVAA